MQTKYNTGFDLLQIKYPNVSSFLEKQSWVSIGIKYNERWGYYRVLVNQKREYASTVCRKGNEWVLDDLIVFGDCWQLYRSKTGVLYAKHEPSFSSPLPLIGVQCYLPTLFDRFKTKKENGWSEPILGLHRFNYFLKTGTNIWLPEYKGMVVDHINRDTLDNDPSNLRLVSIGENNKNRSNPEERKRLMNARLINKEKDCDQLSFLF